METDEGETLSESERELRERRSRGGRKGERSQRAGRSNEAREGRERQREKGKGASRGPSLLHTHSTIHIQLCCCQSWNVSTAVRSQTLHRLDLQRNTAQCSQRHRWMLKQ